MTTGRTLDRRDPASLAYHDDFSADKLLAEVIAGSGVTLLNSSYTTRGKTKKEYSLRISMTHLSLDRETASKDDETGAER